MAGGVSTRTVRAVVFVAVIVFAFWRPLLSGGTLAPDDQVWSAAPFATEAPTDLSIEVAEPDATAIHSAWIRWGAELRDGTLTQLGDGRSGAPTLADGVPATHLLYGIVPGWYAPGLVAAVAMALAMFGMARLAERAEATPEAATFAGLAFGLSGLLFVWYGWPHATAFALVPWVLAAMIAVTAEPDRQSVLRLAVAVALLAWCGIWAITASALVGAGLVSITRFRSVRSLAGPVVGVLTGLALAAPHLLASASRWAWADTTGREAVTDSSAAVASVLTVALGSLWGRDAAGFPWMGSSSAQLSVGFVGLVVVALALVGVRHGASRAGFPLALATSGLAVAYVGGPFATVAAFVAGAGAEHTHARGLLVVGLTLLAAIGLSHVQRAMPSGRRRLDRRIVGIGLVAVVIAEVAVVDWARTARDRGAVRAALAESVGSMLALAILVAVLLAWRRHVLAAPAVVIAASALVVFELLSFGMAIPTVTDRHERLESTEAHRVLDDLVGDDGVIVADGRTFVPAVAARFGPADVRVPRPRSAEEIALLRSIDVGAVRGGATPEQPMLSTLVDTDAWDRLGVDAIVTTPGRPVVGPVTRVRPATVERVDPAGRPFTTTVELVAGVRAVELDLDAPVGVTVQVDVAVDGRFVFGDAVVVTTSPVVVPVPGDGLGATDAIITVRIAVDPEVATLGLDGSGGPAIGIVGGGDGGSLVVADGVVIVHRPTPAVTDDGGADVVVESVDDRSLVLLVEAAAPTELVTDIVDRPGWTVTIDGSVGYRTAGPFVGAEVPSGEHRVEFSYRPPGLVSGGVVIAAAGAIWLLVGPVLVRRRSPAARAVAGSVPSRD